MQYSCASLHKKSQPTIDFIIFLTTRKGEPNFAHTHKRRDSRSIGVQGAGPGTGCVRWCTHVHIYIYVKCGASTRFRSTRCLILVFGKSGGVRRRRLMTCGEIYMLVYTQIQIYQCVRRAILRFPNRVLPDRDSETRSASRRAIDVLIL